MLVCAVTQAGCVASEQLEVIISDETGALVANAAVKVVSGTSLVVKKTNSSGEVVFGALAYPRTPITVTKSGYYMSRTSTTLKRGQVRTSVGLVLRKVENPIPLYAQRLRTNLPKTDQWVYFDLEAADWVSPFGEGSTPDLAFYYTGNYKWRREFEGKLKVKVGGPNDAYKKIEEGIFYESELLLPHSASVPDQGARALAYEVSSRPAGGKAYKLTGFRFFAISSG